MADLDAYDVPLVGLALDQLALSANWSWEKGWTVSATVRWSGDTEWRSRRFWDGLTTEELPQVLEDLLNERYDGAP